MMFRVWGIIRKKNKIIKDMVVEDSRTDLPESEKLHHCIGRICYEFDLQRPIWLPKNQREYEEFRRITLDQDNFIENIDFDTLEFEILDDEES